MAEKKPSSREQVKQIVAQIENGIQELFQSERYADYLRTMSRFHTYSYNNQLLIHMQMPHATQVAGFNKWKNQFGRHVKKGEKGLTIIAPTPFKKRVEEMKLDPDTKAPMTDSDGNIIMEEKEIQIPLFRPVKVFDVSQTEGRPLPSLVSDLAGNVEQYDAFMEALRRTSPVPMEFKPLEKNLDGFFSSKNQSITIREGMSQVQTVCAAVHEITHSILHNRNQEEMTATAGDETKVPPKPKDRNTEEVEAESVSYAVCQYFGIETGANSLGYIATWSKSKTLPELKSSLETISKTANSLITGIERHFQEVCKERGIELSERDALESPSDSPERLVSDLLYLMDGLYREGLIRKNFPQNNREQVKANLVCAVDQDAAVIRNVLNQFISENTGAESAKALLERLDALTSNPPQPDITEPEQDQPVTIPPEETAQDTALDEYPLPAPNMTVSELERDYGYQGGDLLPVMREQAVELFDRDFTVYTIVDGGEAELMLDQSDIEARPPDSIFAISRDEWEVSPDFQQAVAGRMDRQGEREQAFLDHTGDCFAIYQVRDDESLRDIRFESTDWLKSIGRSVERNNYDLVYTGPLCVPDSVDSTLDQLWYLFNNEPPADYHRPSMSVSDIVAVKRDGVVSCHYVDSVGFTALPGFLQDQPLKSAEAALEDSGTRPSVTDLEAPQVKAGQSISLMDLAAATHREREKKSVVAQLKTQPKGQGRKKTAPKRSAEREV